MIEIRRRHSEDRRRGLKTVLATQYGVTRSQIGHIVYGRSWKHLPLTALSSEPS